MIIMHFHGGLAPPHILHITEHPLCTGNLNSIMTTTHPEEPVAHCQIGDTQTAQETQST